MTQHILPDVLAPGLRVVFCGSAAGFKSARVGAYYAGPGNKFWPTLHRVGLTPRLITPSEFRAVLAFGIGLTDLCKTGFGNDVDLDPTHDDVAGLLRKVRRYRPRVLAFTAKRPAGIVLRALGAGKEPPAYGLQQIAIGETKLFVLTSPSGRAGAFWDERSWRELKSLALEGEGGIACVSGERVKQGRRRRPDADKKGGLAPA